MSVFRENTALGVDPEKYKSKTGAIGLPEFGTSFVRSMLEETQPTTVSELIRISGLSHGTDVWINNAQDLIRNDVATLRECICCRDDIMIALIGMGVEPLMSFTDVYKRQGPKVVSWQRGETQYSIRLIPLGGFCRFLGEDENNSDPRSLTAAPLGKRFMTIFAGAFFNIILAFLLAFFLMFGLGDNVPTVAGLLPDSNSAAAGIQEGDIVLSLIHIS